MLKRVDVAVYEAMKAGEALETGKFMTLGLAEEGVGYAVDEHNEALLSDDMKAKVEEARAGIIDGSIDVTAYYTNDSCPVLDF
jgi:basic membrane protein A